MPPEETGDRYERQTRFFGADGQRRISAARVAIVGLGGLGAHVAQQLGYLGVVDYVVVDRDTVTTSNLNRLVDATPADAEAGIAKVEVAGRLAKAIQPSAVISKVAEDVDSTTAEAHLSNVEVVFGCVDNDLSRLYLTQHCATHGIPYFDLATDISVDGSWYGGRVIAAVGGQRCPSCVGELDQREIARASMPPEQREADDRIYGVNRAELDETGPSVVSLNGVVASLAVTEWMLFVTGKRDAVGHMTYRGDSGTIRISRDEPTADCYFCKTLWPQARRDSNPA